MASIHRKRKKSWAEGGGAGTRDPGNYKGSEEKGEEDGEAFPGKSSLPCHGGQKRQCCEDRGLWEHNARAHATKGTEKTHRGSQGEPGSGDEENRCNEFSPQQLQIAILPHCTIPPCRFVSSRKLERKHHFLSPPQPPLPQCLNTQFFLPQFLKQEERAKKPYCLLCLFQPLPQVLAAVRSTPLQPPEQDPAA